MKREPDYDELRDAADEGAMTRSVRTLEQLDALNSDELVEGYLDGFRGEIQPGHNRSLAYWHGWRNGAVDGKHREKDDEQALLARLYIERQRAKRAAGRPLDGETHDGMPG